MLAHICPALPGQVSILAKGGGALADPDQENLGCLVASFKARVTCSFHHICGFHGSQAADVSLRKIILRLMVLPHALVQRNRFSANKCVIMLIPIHRDHLLLKKGIL